MTYRLFQYPLPAPPELEDLNAWLASERIVSVENHIISQPSGAMLVFVVQSLAGPSPASKATRERIDYRKVLDTETFARFSRLRDERKKIAAELGVPVYAVFTNEQLAEMAKRHPATLAAWKAIDGIGEARLSQHGERPLASLEATSPTEL